MSELGKLWYTLGLDTKDFDSTIKSLKDKIQDLQGKSVSINADSATTALGRVEELQKALNKLKDEVSLSVTGVPKTLEGGTANYNAQIVNLDAIRTEVENALKNLAASIDVNAIKTQLANVPSLKIDVTASQSTIQGVIKKIKDLLNINKVSIKVSPDWSKSAITKLQNDLQKQIKNIDLKDIKVTIDKSKIQEELNKGSYRIKVDVDVNREGLSEKVSSAVSQNANLRTGDTSRHTAEIREQNKHLTDQLGVRRAINDQMAKSTQIATMLGNAFGNVFAAYQLKNFLEGLIEIGGEIQKQRLALGHIIGSISEANVLFDQMKDLAVKSPFGLLDLMKNARQLSAFGVEYNNLYDTMKRLSDIAAGLGIDFGRISLAFGETMERGFLDGKLVRQFSYMGLPVLQKIAEYYTQIDKAGNGQIFSASDVRKMVSNREVGFEDLSDVIKKMTDEGGQFFNMQEVMAESVAGKWKNLKDAYDIMLSDITEGNSQLLKAPAEILTSLTRNYEYFIPLLGEITVLMLGAKTASKFFTSVLGEQTASVYKSILAEKEKIAIERQRAAALKGASMSQLAALNAEKMLTAEEARQLVIKGKLTASELKYIAIRQGVSKENAALLFSLKLISAEEMNMIMTSGKLGLSWDMLKLRAKLFGMQVGVATAQLRAMTYAMLSNPMTWMFAVVGAAMELWHVISKVNEENDKLREGMTQSINDVASNAKDIQKRVTLNFDVVDGKNKYNATIAEMQTAIDSLVEFIKDKVSGAQDILNEAFELNNNGEYKHSIEERYEILKKYFDEISRFADDVSTKNIINEMTDKLSAKWYNALFDDDLLRDASDYEKNFKNVKESLKSALDDAGTEVEKVVKSWQKKLGTNNVDAMLEELLKPANESKYRDFMSQLRNKIGIIDYVNVSWGYSNYKADFEEYQQELKNHMAEVEKIIKSHGLDPNKSTDKKNVEFLIHTYLENTEASTWVKEHMIEDYKTNWNLNVSMSGDVQQAKDWMKERFGQYAQESISETYDEMKKKNKEIEGKLKTLQEGQLRNAKKDASGRYVSNPALQKYIDEANGYIDQLKDLATMAKNEGISLVEPPKATNSGSKKDTVLEQFKERVDNLKKAYSEFQKWSAKVGKEKAGEELGKLGLMGGLKKEDLADPKAYLNQINALIKEWQGKVGNDTARKKQMTALLQLKADVELNIKEEEIKRNAEKVSQEINKAAKQYDIWKTWFNATGNEELAFEMSVNLTPIWNTQSNTLKNQLEKSLKDANVDLSKVLADNNISDMWGIDVLQEDMKKVFDNAGLTEQYNKYKAIYDLIWKSGEQFSKDIANSVKSLQKYEDKVAIIEKKYTDLLDADKKLGGNNQIDLQRAKDLELSKIYKPIEQQFLSASTTLAKSQAVEVYQALLNKLNKLFNDGSISAEEYNNQLKKLDDALQKNAESSKSSVEALLKGGKNGLITFFKTQLESIAYRKDALEDTIRNQGFMTDEQAAEMASLDKMAKAYENSIAKIGDFTSSLSLVNAGLAVFIGALNGFKQIFQSFSEVFDALGNEGASNLTSDIAEGIGAVSSAFDGISGVLQSAINLDIGGIIGNALSAPFKLFTSPITAFAQLHDKKQQRIIDENKFQNTILGNINNNLSQILERTLGGIYQTKLDDETRKALINIANNKDEYTGKDSNYSDATRNAARKAVEDNSYYQAQYANLLTQRDNLQDQLNAEQDKKKTDDSAVEDYKKQLAEITDQIRYFAEDMMKSLYNINFKDWASQLSDSLVEAWVKGEDAAEAYEQTVKDLMKSVTQSVVSQKIIETALQPVLDQFTDKFVDADGKLDISQISWLTSKLNELNPQIVDAVTLYLDELKNMGVDLSDTESESSASSSIKGITEETADILASYINGIRLDLSIQRLAVEQIRDAIGGIDGTSISAIAQSQLTQLQNIASHTSRTADAVEALRDNFVDVTTGAKQLSIQ